MPHALIVDDDLDTRAGLAELTGRQGFTTDTASSLGEAREKMLGRRPDVVLLDLQLPDGNGMDLFQDIESRSKTEVVLITGHASLQTSIEALRLGATDYLTKPVNLKHLKNVLSRVARPADLKAEIDELRGDLRSLGRFGRLIGVSPAMQKVYDEIGRVAPTAATVLITGESGTGKELVAQTIHDLSRRRNEVFLPVNCGAIQAQLIESELFGHEKGSFTGATREHKGYFEQADGGTLFLDEVGEMPSELQVKLLRVLETGTFMRVGADKQIETDVRVIAATNRNPLEAIAEGKLREDLHYRLQVFPLQMPPLRERGEDIELIANHYLGELNRTESAHKIVSPGALERLRSYIWPGNIRELKNVIHRAFIMADDVIDVHWLPPDLGAPCAVSGKALDVPVGMSLKEAERALILATLEHCGGSKQATARMLATSLKTLYNRLKDYGVK